jgi:hypothetical protein
VELHDDYESTPEYPLELIENLNEPLDWHVETEFYMILHHGS